MAYNCPTLVRCSSNSSSSSVSTDPMTVTNSLPSMLPLLSSPNQRGIEYAGQRSFSNTQPLENSALSSFSSSSSSVSSFSSSSASFPSGMRETDHRQVLATLRGSISNIRALQETHSISVSRHPSISREQQQQNSSGTFLSSSFLSHNESETDTAFVSVAHPFSSSSLSTRSPPQSVLSYSSSSFFPSSSSSSLSSSQSHDNSAMKRSENDTKEMMDIQTFIQTKGID